MDVDGVVFKPLASTRTAYYNEAMTLPQTDELVAVASLIAQTTPDVTIASLFATFFDFGWGPVEEELRLHNQRYHADNTAASWILSSFRGGMRQELVMCNYRLNPRHGEIMGRSLNPFSRLKRLVLVHNKDLKSQGAAGLANGLTSAGNTLEELLLDDCGVDDEGAVALATSLSHDSCRLITLQLEENMIHDYGAVALATALMQQRAPGCRAASLQLLGLGGNHIGTIGQSLLTFAVRHRKFGSVLLSSRFFPSQKGQLFLASLRSSHVPPNVAVLIRELHAGRNVVELLQAVEDGDVPIATAVTGTPATETISLVSSPKPPTAWRAFATPTKQMKIHKQ